MKLFYSPGACSLAPHIVAREAGLSPEIEKVDLPKRTTESGRPYLEVNPKGYVPALQTPDGTVMTEVSALIQFLADQAPETGLMPAAGTPERYKVLEWIGFVSTEIHKGFGPLWNPASPDAVKQAAKDKLFQRFSYIDQQLAGRSYLMGEQFTAADAYLFVVTNWSRFHGISLDAYPNLAAFMERVAARPRVQEALRAEGLLKAA